MQGWSSGCGHGALVLLDQLTRACEIDRAIPQGGFRFEGEGVDARVNARAAFTAALRHGTQRFQQIELSLTLLLGAVRRLGRDAPALQSDACRRMLATVQRARNACQPCSEIRDLSRIQRSVALGTGLTHL